ncbi:MAG: hypothetical protein WC325_12775 [Candidatus Bathyarchaeia archaeon]|jgi:hypothetical protein
MQTKDKYIQLAKPIVKAKFQDRLGIPQKIPYHLTQIEVIWENDFFHWITGQAANQLVEEKFLSKIETSTKTQDKVVFFFNAKLDTPDSKKQVLKHVKIHCQLIDKYSDDEILKNLGKHLEALVRAELRAQGFTIAETHSNKYNERKWTKTNHNLDFIAEHHSNKLTIGVEVKNTLQMMKKDEIEIKLQICDYLKITPVFAVRWLKPYADMVKTRGGFSWMFKTQIYPLGNEQLTQTLYNRLELPVKVRTDLPEKTIPIFQKWVESKIQ